MYEDFFSIVLWESKYVFHTGMLHISFLCEYGLGQIEVWTISLGALDLF